MSRTFRKIVINKNHHRYGWFVYDDMILNKTKYKSVDNYYMQDGKMTTTTKKSLVKNHCSSRGRMLFRNELNKIMNCPDYEEYTYPDYRRQLRKVWSEYF